MNATKISSKQLQAKIQNPSSDSDEEKGGYEVVRPESKTLCRQGMGVQEIHPLLAQLAGDPTTAIQQLQSLVLAERSGRGERSGPNPSIKRFYTVQQQTIPNGTLLHMSLASISPGTQTNQRISDVLALQHLTISLLFNRTVTAASSASASPTVRWLIWRDKVPATPGTATGTLSTDTNPPASNTDLYSRLGQSGVGYNAVAVRAPDPSNRYHVYKAGHFKVTTHPSYWNGTALVAPPNYRFIEHHSISLNNVEVTFADDSTSNPMLNALYISFFSDQDYTGTNLTDQVTITSDLTFRDRQL